MAFLTVRAAGAAAALKYEHESTCPSACAESSVVTYISRPLFNLKALQDQHCSPKLDVHVPYLNYCKHCNAVHLTKHRMSLLPALGAQH